MICTYPIARGAAELERLRLQAQIWQPDAEVLLDQIGVEPGWACVDLGCGPVGVLESLSRRLGPDGRIVGLDVDQGSLDAARSLAIDQLDLVRADATESGLPSGAFDLVHARFLLAPAGHEEALVREMVRLARAGGTIAVQEPDSCSWGCYPEQPDWQRLRQLITVAFRTVGGDFDAGRRTYGLLRAAGLEDVRMRGAVKALPFGHPYRRLPIQLASSLRVRILEAGLLSERELDLTLDACEHTVADPETYITTFTVTQVWGRKPDP